LHKFNENTIKIAINDTPAKAGISVEQLESIANFEIAKELVKATSISFGTGLPGGVAMLASIPADMIQYQLHTIRIIQKLRYLYGWKEVNVIGSNIMNEARDEITLFMGAMYGIEGAKGALRTFSVAIIKEAEKNAAKQFLSKLTAKTAEKTAYQNLNKIAKLIAEKLGMQLSNKALSKGISKGVPIFSGFVSGGLTFIMFEPAAKRLKNELKKLPQAQCNN